MAGWLILTPEELAIGLGEGHRLARERDPADPVAPPAPDPRSVYAPFWRGPGNGYDYQAMEDAGFDVS